MAVGGVSATGPVRAESVVEAQSVVGLLKTGDRLRITVVGFPDLSGEQLILPDGTLQLPLAGNIQLAGLSAKEANYRITETLRPYVRRPQVALAVLSRRPARISITGEVLQPGPRLLQPPPEPQASNSSTASVDNVNLQTVSYVLALAGGVTPNADIRQILIRRSHPVAGEGEPKITELTVDLWQVVQSGDLAADPVVMDGDEIVVPTASQPNRGDQQRLLLSTIAPSRITVQVGGEVQRPGPVEVLASADINSAIAAAGGLTDKASAKSLTLLRMMPDGRIAHKTYALGDRSDPLMNGDVIVVKKSGFRRLLDNLGNILAPLSPFLLLGR